jgi:uncharacterized protein (UPF0216 family)
MADNFNLKKFLTESKALENLNSILAKENLSEDNARDKIREMILAELGNSNSEKIQVNGKLVVQKYNEMMGKNPSTTFKDVAKALNLPEEEVSIVLRSTTISGGGMFEAKKKKDEEVEDIEVTDTETEEVPTEDMPDEEVPTDGGDLEDVTANMDGDGSGIMMHLTKALEISKGMNNDKLTTQIGNTLKFFVSTYIGGDE